MNAKPDRDAIRARVEAELRRHLETLTAEDLAFARAALQMLTERHPDWIANPLDHDVVLALVDTFIEAGQPLPAPLDQFARELIAGHRKRRPGRSRSVSRRDGAVVFAMAAAVRAGLKPYRNEASEAHSAADVVAETATTLGHPLGYHGVVEIWRRRSDIEKRMIEGSLPLVE